MSEIIEKKIKIIKGKDLKPGDIINHIGMVSQVDIKGNDFFWEKPNYTYYDLNDCIYGGLSSILDLDAEFEILTERKDIINTYKSIDYQILSHIADTNDRRKELKKVFNIVIDNLNKEKKP